MNKFKPLTKLQGKFNNEFQVSRSQLIQTSDNGSPSHEDIAMIDFTKINSKEIARVNLRLETIIDLDEQNKINKSQYYFAL